MFKNVLVIIIYFFFILKGSIANAQYSPIFLSGDPESVKITKDTLKAEKETPIKDTVEYDADTQDHDLLEKKSYLIGNASVKYTDMNISANYIEINWKTDMIYARGKLNVLGKSESSATLTQAGKKYEYDSFYLNFKTKKGNFQNIRTEEQEGVIISKRVLRKNDSVNLMRDALYTTDTYFKDKKTEDPDYFLKARKIKYYDKQSIITGPVFIYIYKTPFPIPLPFSYIPFSERSSAGFISPRCGENNDQGFFIEDLGFFWPISDYWQAKIFSSFYTSGSLAIRSITDYKKRYKYSGGFQFNYDMRINGTRGLDNYGKFKNYQIRWNHTQDKSAHPSLTFSSSINFSSSKFYREGLSIDNINNGKVYNNNSNSSISLDKIFGNIATMKLKIVDLSQNFNTREIRGAFPSFTLNVNRQNPFSNKNDRFLQNLYIDYNSSASNKIKTSEESFFKNKMFDNMKTGIHHELKFGSTLKILKYIRLSPNITYDEVWDLQSIEKRWDWDVKEKKETEQILVKKGFKSFRTFSVGAELNTTLYGFMRFKTDTFFQALRHKVDPKVTFRYAPDFTKPFWGYYKIYNVENAQKIPYSIFDSSSYIGALSNTSGRKVEFSLNNNLEMKVRDESQVGGVRKITLLERFNFNTHYNLDKETFKWSDIDFSGNTSFTKNISTQFIGRINLYKTITDVKGPSKKIRVDKIGPFTMKNFNLNFSYSLNNETFQKEDSKKKEDIYKKKGEIRYEKFVFDKDNYAHYSLPWSLNTSISYNYDRSYVSDIRTHRAELRFDGKLSPTPYWKITFDGYYDLMGQKITRLNLKFERDLRSFSMNFNWTPVSSGFGSTWNFFIGIKANVLKDLKFDKKESFSRSMDDF
ncbi:putative LPS assembly protein LptD [Bacteroidetes bacterium endosymbiont of Geopemphigus sp.]|uniref:putative LPS assembly protein LptD n=1 Tax=Bacteroidetes bacterium endosymbiont of Geopemphigus sp. TaxID=2047937 RepID=UPI0011AF3468|nr:putative LPS assembly protein LptD [Bacteroidetes bacterium endosymbiont of Geopemphigus sp.]